MVPKYQFYTVAEDKKDDKYQLDFNSVYECDDSMKKVGNSVALSALDWTFGPVTKEDGGVYFSMKSSATSMFSYVEFVNHLAANETNAARVKFDIKLEGMKWQKSTAKLCFEYRFHSTGKDDDPKDVKDGKKASVGEANFGIEEEAEDGAGKKHRVQVCVGAQTRLCVDACRV